MQKSGKPEFAQYKATYGGITTQQICTYVNFILLEDKILCVSPNDLSQ